MIFNSQDHDLALANLRTRLDSLPGKPYNVLLELLSYGSLLELDRLVDALEQRTPFFDYRELYQVPNSKSLVWLIESPVQNLFSLLQVVVSSVDPCTITISQVSREDSSKDIKVIAVGYTIKANKYELSLKTALPIRDGNLKIQVEFPTGAGKAHCTLLGQYQH